MSTLEEVIPLRHVWTAYSIYDTFFVHLKLILLLFVTGSCYRRERRQFLLWAALHFELEIFFLPVVPAVGFLLCTKTQHCLENWHSPQPKESNHVEYTSRLWDGFLSVKYFKMCWQMRIVVLSIPSSHSITISPLETFILCVYRYKNQLDYSHSLALRKWKGKRNAVFNSHRATESSCAVF